MLTNVNRWFINSNFTFMMLQPSFKFVDDLRHSNYEIYVDYESNKLIFLLKIYNLKNGYPEQTY